MTTGTNHQRTSHGSHPRRIVFWSILGVVAALFLAGSGYFGMIFLAHSNTVAELATNSARAVGERLAAADTPSIQGRSNDPAGADIPTRQASDPRFAFLLMGYGGGGHDGAYLTDSMMVVIVDPSRKSLTLISLPRDIWTPIVFDGRTPVYNKLNTAYAFGRDSSLYTDRLPRYKGSQGAGLLAMDTVSRLLGIPISNYLALDFAGFRQMIDVVGGIDVDIPDSFSAEYPANDDPSIDDSWTIVRFRKGLEHMNGERAIEYARARETIDNVSEGSDFARSRRQRLIMEAFKTRLLQPEGLVHLPQLFAVAASHVDTNYSLPSVSQFTQMAMDWKNVRFYETALTNANYLAEATGPGGTYVLVPAFPEQSWAPIRALARRLWQNPGLGVAMANTEIVVENDTGVAGVAGRLSDALSRLGYRVGTPITGTGSAGSKVVDRTGGESKELIAQLASDLGLHLDEVVPEKGSGGIILAIGSDDVGVADLAVPADPSAPSSAVGIVRAGSWSSTAPAPLPTETITSAPQPAVEPDEATPTSPTPTRGPLATPTTTHAGTPMPTPPTSQSASAAGHPAAATPMAGPPHVATPTAVSRPRTARTLSPTATRSSSGSPVTSPR